MAQDKFQKMLEYLVNEQQDKAEALFHEIVVEKSRQIYETILAEELEKDEEVEESDDEDEVNESEHEDEEVEEDFNLDEFEVEADDEMGGDPTDDMGDDMGGDDMDADMGGDDMDADMGGDEPVTQDDIKDLEAELADLKAEFEDLLSQGDMGDDEEGMDDMGDMGDDEEGMDDMGDMGGDQPEESFESYKSSAELMREYVNKIGGNQYNQYGKMGDNGTNTKSVVAGKNDMGGTTQNILRGDTEAGVEANKGNLHGNPVSDQNPKDMNTGNVNVPGGKAAKSLKAMPKGHGAEKKGSGDTAPNKKPIIGK